MTLKSWTILGICFVVSGAGFIVYTVLNDIEAWQFYIVEIQKTSNIDWIKFLLFMIWITLWGKK